MTRFKLMSETLHFTFGLGLGLEKQPVDHLQVHTGISRNVSFWNADS